MFRLAHQATADPCCHSGTVQKRTVEQQQHHTVPWTKQHIESLSEIPSRLPNGARVRKSVYTDRMGRTVQDSRVHLRVARVVAELHETRIDGHVVRFSTTYTHADTTPYGTVHPAAAAAEAEAQVVAAEAAQRSSQAISSPPAKLNSTVWRAPDGALFVLLNGQRRLVTSFRVMMQHLDASARHNSTVQQAIRESIWNVTSAELSGTSR